MSEQTITTGRYLIKDLRTVTDAGSLTEITIIEVTRTAFKYTGLLATSTGAWMSFDEFEQKYRIVEHLSPSYVGEIKYTPNYSYTVPNCCKGCSNHPNNGGSGVCHCTAPMNDLSYPFRVTCSTTTSYSR